MVDLFIRAISVTPQVWALRHRDRGEKIVASRERKFPLRQRAGDRRDGQDRDPAHRSACALQMASAQSDGGAA